MRIKLIAAVVVPVLLVVGAVTLSVRAYRTPSVTEEKTVMIPPHTSARAVLNGLHNDGLIPSVPLIALPAFALGHMSSLKAGEYNFVPGMSPEQIISKLVRGDIVIHKVTIPEGWNRFAVYTALMAEPLLTGPLPEEIPEGSIFPDTMRFTRGEARTAVLARMQKARTDMLAPLWPARETGLPLTSPEAALALASVVERETGVAGERAMVAGVFINRLRKGMPLQSDPTVVYGIEVAQGGKPLGRALTTRDLKTDTPYNSYTRTGLPPTPICNPGRDALIATLHPAQTDALYFVATGHGGHRFAATLKEHEANVALYRQAMAEKAQ